MLRLTPPQVAVLFPTRSVLQPVPVACALLDRAPCVSQYVNAGVSVRTLLGTGLSVSELLGKGLDGRIFADANGRGGAKVREARFAGLEGQWDALVTWGLTDLANADASLADFALLGVTLPSLRARGLRGDAFVACKQIHMVEWHAMGITKRDLLAMNLKSVHFQEMGWVYTDCAELWGWNTEDMRHLGFQLQFGFGKFQ